MQLDLMFEDGYQIITNYKIMWLGSLFFIILINSIGILPFQVKDLKSAKYFKILASKI